MELYQKLGIAVIKLSRDLLGKEVGDKIKSINQYVEDLNLSRGTIQNAIQYIESDGAVKLIKRGHMGTFVDKVDYQKLQILCEYKNFQGIMPLPYSKAYQGLATAIYECLSEVDVNLVYSRGAKNRIKLVSQGIYQFAICSKFAAEQSINSGENIDIIIDFGEESYLSKHVLLFRDKNQSQVTDRMKIALDKSSIDQSEIVKIVTKGKKDIEFIEMRTHQTMKNLLSGAIDVGVWNFDNVSEIRDNKLHMVPIDYNIGLYDLSTAVLVVKQGEEDLGNFISKHLKRSDVIKIQSDVISETIVPNY